MLPPTTARPVLVSAMYVWLTNTRQLWKVRFEVWLGFYGVFAFSASLLLLFGRFFAGSRASGFLGIWVTVGLWAIYGIGLFVQDFLVYHCIRCPECGLNPARRKADNRPMNRRVLYGKLAQLEECPRCGSRTC
jgi:hypothetical protein